ncbi:MAG: nicotinate (nicotinamide) nucleotide adenylyltransferase [Clostridiaceae bacterium]|jgi:nicotinate-nucleotide adenylyltransferase|nr:nicotinate (nicotinamide) nucleotide adenylyltransferase [Clostridiaceae bacterium]
MKLCVFQGTFNPIHNAHLNMAQYVIDNFGFDKILFIPAAKPPHKTYDENFSIHRLNMVKIAVEGNEHFDVSDIEYKRNSKSYTYLTIQELYKKYDITGKINFIIGTDAFEKIKTWYKTEDLKNLVDFIIFMRDDNFDKNKLNYLSDDGYNYKFAKMDFIDISSTEIRKRVKDGSSISGLVPFKVEEYIKQNELYKS